LGASSAKAPGRQALSNPPEADPEKEKLAKLFHRETIGPTFDCPILQPSHLTPMKRHESLYPLSHDHHHALRHAKHLQQVGTEKTTERPREVAENFLRFWVQDGRRHFREEEEVLLPTFARFADANRPEVVELLLQHIDLRRRIDELTLLLQAGKVPDLAMLHQLGTVLHDHIRLEERQVFPAIEQAVPEEALRRMAQRFEVRQRACGV